VVVGGDRNRQQALDDQPLVPAAERGQPIAPASAPRPEPGAHEAIDHPFDIRHP